MKANGFRENKNSQIDRLIEELSKENKKLLRTEYLKYVVLNPEADVCIIMSKCSSDYEFLIDWSEIKNMFQKFKKFEEIYCMWPSLAHAKFKIVFCEKVKKLFPNTKENCRGLACCKEGTLYIGSDVDFKKRLGTFAHETSHFVFHLIYEHRCLPYCINDKAKEKKWREIFNDVKKECEDNKNDPEEIIDRVFSNSNYKEGYIQLAELAVRVNHVLAFYFEMDDFVEKLEKRHPSLFDYCRKMIKDLKIPNAYRMIKLNNDFELFEEIERFSSEYTINSTVNFLDYMKTLKTETLIVASNIPNLTLFHIFQEINDLCDNKLCIKAKNLYVNLKNIDQTHVKEEVKLLITLKSVEMIIVKGDSFSEEQMKIFKEVKGTVSLLFICNQKFAKSFGECLSSAHLMHNYEYNNFGNTQLKLRKKIIN